MEKLSACSSRLLICGDFNINWVDKENSFLKNLLNLLETYNLVQHITEPTHRSQHLLNYIISDADLVNSAGVSDFISDHCALHASLVCTHSHPKRKQITFRPLKLLMMIYCLLIFVKSILTLILKMWILLLTIITLFLLHYWINMHH